MSRGDRFGWSVFGFLAVLLFSFVMVRTSGKIAALEKRAEELHDRLDVLFPETAEEAPDGQ